jgi:hypothetical protein
MVIDTVPGRQLEEAKLIGIALMPAVVGGVIGYLAAKRTGAIVGVLAGILIDYALLRQIRIYGFGGMSGIRGMR